MNLFTLPGLIMGIVSLGMFIAQAVAFIDSLTHPKEAYVAGDKLTKPAWCLILGLALAAHMLMWSPLSLFNLVGIVAAIVYLVDVRPTLRALTRR